MGYYSGVWGLLELVGLGTELGVALCIKAAESGQGGTQLWPWPALAQGLELEAAATSSLCSEFIPRLLQLSEMFLRSFLLVTVITQFLKRWKEA